MLYTREPIRERLVRERWSGASAADTELTVSTNRDAIEAPNPIPHDVPRDLVGVTVDYSAAVTEDVTITLKSGLGAEYDTPITTAALANARHVYFKPDGGRQEMMSDEYVEVVAPAGGGVITSAVRIYTEAWD